MAQKSSLLVFLVAALGFQWALAEESVSQTAPPPVPSAATPLPSPVSTATPTGTPVPRSTPSASPSATPVRPTPPSENQKLDTLTPEQRKRFQANLDRWTKMPKVQQEELRREAKFHRERILQEINEAIEKTGLKLDEQQRQVFTFRYAQERRTLEEKLRQEVEAKRREAIMELIWQLGAEFQPLPPDSQR